MDFLVTLNIYRSLYGSTHRPLARVFRLHSGPIAAAPYPLHVAGGMASRRRLRASIAKVDFWEGHLGRRAIDPAVQGRVSLSRWTDFNRDTVSLETGLRPRRKLETPF